MERNGIIAAGNWILDRVKILDAYPAEETLANILSESASNGGSPYNILKDLSKMGAPFPLEGIGLIGNDATGEFILKDCNKHNIISSQIKKTDKANTSYTDVMTAKADGKRTFFHYRGANAFLDVEDFNLSASKAKIFHLGYLLLLDKLDLINKDGTTGAANVLKLAQKAGFTTSIDIVSENSDRFKKVISPSIPFVDYLFINEFEAEKLTEIKTLDEKKINIEACIKAASHLLEMGVKKWVILHFPMGAIAISKEGQKVYQGSVDLPPALIKGAVGAGDAFAAGALLGIHENMGMDTCLELGVAAAASCLFKEDCSEGILRTKDCLEIGKTYGYRKIKSV